MPESEHPMVRCLAEHQAALDSLRAASGQLASATAPLNDEAQRIFDDVDAGATEEACEKARHEMPLSKTTDFLQARRAFENASLAGTLLPQSLLVGMVSQHDAFMERLIHWVFTSRPDLRASLKATVAYGECSRLEDLDELLQKLVDDEIHNVLRGSHIAQLAWLGELLGMRLDSDPALLARFREVVQRRHVYAHNAGRVTARYLDARRAVEPDFQPGESGLLELSPQVLDAASFTLMEIAVKLWQVVWRKAQPDELDLAEEALYRLAYNLLVFEDFDLAVCVLEFALDQPKYANENIRRKNIVNLAQAYKWRGEEERCRERLKGDWSAFEESFDLAIAVLKDDFASAERLMLRVGAHGDIVEQAFRDWPLFRRFRESEQFARAYAQLFGRSRQERVA